MFLSVLPGAHCTRIADRFARIATGRTMRCCKPRFQVHEEPAEGTERYMTDSTRITRIADHFARIADRLARVASDRFARIATGCTMRCCKSRFQVHEEPAERTERAIAAVSARITWITDRYAWLASNRYARLASNRHTGLACDGFTRLASNRFTGVTAIPDCGKASKNAGFGSRCSRKYDNRGQRGQQKFVFHFNSPKNTVGEICWQRLPLLR